MDESAEIIQNIQTAHTCMAHGVHSILLMLDIHVCTTQAYKLMYVCFSLINSQLENTLS